jgi:hypothetical protein
LIDHCPFRIAAVGCGGSGGEVGGESELADEGIKEALPFGVIGFREVEFNWDMVANVDGLQHGVRGKLDDNVGEGIGVIGGTGGRAVGEISIEEEIFLEGIHEEVGSGGV